MDEQPEKPAEEIPPIQDGGVQDTPEQNDDSQKLSELGSNEEVSETELGVPSNNEKKPEKPRKSKKKLLIPLLVLLLLAAAAGGWYYWKHKKQPTPAANNSNNQAQTTPRPSAPTFEANTVVYAFKAKEADPLFIFWRPASGGDRTEALKLAKDEAPSVWDVNGSNVAAAVGPDVLISTDAGKSYTKIFSGVGTAQITSLSFSGDGTRLAIAYLQDVGGKNIVKSIDLKGADEKDLFTNTKPGVFIVGWSNEKQQIVYEEGCYNCDGGRSGLFLQDISKKKVTQLLKSTDPKELGNVAVSGDFSTMIYWTGTLNPAAADSATFVGEFVGAPYTVGALDLSTLKDSTISTFGTKGEKNANGTYRTRNVFIGFMAGGAMPYYSDDANLYTVTDGKATNVYTADKKLQYVLYVSDKSIISGSGDATDNYALTNYNVDTKKATAIFSGDNNTYIFGVTTK